MPEIRIHKFTDENTSDFLQHAEVNIYGDAECKGFYKNRLRNLPEGIVNEQICAGDLQAGKDTCQVS